MIITASDERNFQVVIDALQAKHLVALCHQLLIKPEAMQYMIAASLEVNLDGFETLGTDTLSAAMSLLSVLGFWTKQVKSVKPGEAPVEPPSNVADVVEQGDMEDNKKEEVTPKPPVN